MTETISFPPIFRPLSVATDEDVLAHASTLAAGGADPATLLWADREDRLGCAVVLAPAEPWARSVQVVFCGALALRDALASILPPGVDVGFAWPGSVRVNDSKTGGIELRGPDDLAAADVPDWLALGAELAIAGQPRPRRSPGEEPETTLAFEDCTGITMPQALEAFSRHLLTWINRWQDDGFEPVRATWRAHAYNAGKDVVLGHGGDIVEGTYEDLTSAGDLRLRVGDRVRTISILDRMGAH